MSLEGLIKFFDNLKLTFKASFMRSNSHNLKNVGNTNTESRLITGTIGTLNLHQGVSLNDVREIVDASLDQRLALLPDTIKAVAVNVVNERTSEYKQLLQSKTSELSVEDYPKFSEPAVIETIKYSGQISGLLKTRDSRELLANLVIKRIKNETPDDAALLPALVYDEAIKTIAKLTSNQLKIVTSCYLLRYTMMEGISNWAQFNAILDTKIKPFIDFHSTNAQFQHIEYAGCGAIGIGAWSPLALFKSSYAILFSKIIPNSEIQKLELEEKTITELFTTTEAGYRFKYQSHEHFIDYGISIGLTKATAEQLLSIYKSYTESDSAIDALIRSNTASGAQIVDVVKESQLGHLSLTSVGIAIAATYFEQVTGSKININIWIN